MLRFTILLVLVAVCALAAEGAKPKDPLIGNWRGVLASDYFTYQFTLTVKANGKLFTGTLLNWRNVPEDLALRAAKGQPPPPGHGYDKPCIYSEQVRMARKDGRVLIEGHSPQKLLGGINVVDRFSLAETEPGLLCGNYADKDGNLGSAMVLMCPESAWTTPCLPPPPAGKTTGINCVGTSFHYQVYVPKGYDPAKPAPLVVHSNPGGNAKPLSTKLADEFGWIMIGLTEARNGPYQVIVHNRAAALFDLRLRLAIDWRQVFFAGDSGGARSSSLSAMTYPDLCAGLLLSIGAYPEQAAPHPRIPIFFITGDKDPNLGEVEGAYRDAKAARRPTELLRHKGGHENGGQANIEQALRWLHDHAAPYGAVAPKKR